MGWTASQPGADGQDGQAGRDGRVFIDLIPTLAASPLTNGNFSNGTAFFLQSGVGEARIVDLAGNPALLMSTETGPFSLTQFVSTNTIAPLLLQFDLQFLTDAGSLQNFLDDDELFSLSSPGTMSAFQHVSLLLHDPSLFGRDAADLEIRLNPESLAQVQLDNLAFQPQQAGTVIPEPSSLVLFGIGAIGLFGYGWRRRRKSGNAQ